ncbi:type I restriction endonuclease subunit R [Mycoplasma amphoriforme]|uniref:Type I restriction enzyme endonuclease subunit n=1 Tax=Mycoplasma amphoriforme A39 TaxID=572419 RepID=A0A292IIQ6_9MOLU|nr:unnamed protein product [Mycoplasma amphoriforme A39]
MNHNFNKEPTVIDEFRSKINHQGEYESELELENKFITNLTEQGYEYLPINNHEELKKNLRKQIQRLNNTTYEDQEWNSILNNYFLNPQHKWTDKTKIIQDKSKLEGIKQENKIVENIKIFDTKNFSNNQLQVINQYTATGCKTNRYDVTILLNGIPIVHCELKARGVKLKTAFDQIERYQNESFWADGSLFNFVQIFVISNGTETKYYSNTTRHRYLDNHNHQSTSESKPNNSFTFTSYWTDSKNKVINDLQDFAITFFNPEVLQRILFNYCIFTEDKSLLVMRPYQIHATEKIIKKVIEAHQNQSYGEKAACGYVWHATGSGKTVTSFKTAKLLASLQDDTNSFISKVIFVVDRKDLDIQTMREYDNLEKNAANGTFNTDALKKALVDSTKKIIVTTIQKISKCLKEKNDSLENSGILEQEIVFIFDEAHRSQFGEMHKLIISKFKKYYLFGFTGTPIFADDGNNLAASTDQTFGERLATYSLLDAINNHNVLSFHVEFIKTFDIDDQKKIIDQQVDAINEQEVFRTRKRIENIVQFILKRFSDITKQKQLYEYQQQLTSDKFTNNQKNKSKFNSLFAVSDIELAKRYYDEFKKQQALLPDEQKLKIAIIYSQNPNEVAKENELDGNLGDENNEDASQLDEPSLNFLQNAINDYYAMFNDNKSTNIASNSSLDFHNYYKNLSKKVRDCEIDILIVVNMFLTGFDAPRLNTIWIDKYLQRHGLIQTFSRTNRIYNSLKPFGNVICFRNLDDQINDALEIYGVDEQQRNLIFGNKYEQYYNRYCELVKAIKTKFPLDNQDFIKNYVDADDAKKEFAILFMQLLKHDQFLRGFSDFGDKELITPMELQDYQSHYQRIRSDAKNASKEGNIKVASIYQELAYNCELVEQYEITPSYIMNLIQESVRNKDNTKNNERTDLQTIISKITKFIESNSFLLSKKDLIIRFVYKVNYGSLKIDRNLWVNFYENEKENDLNKLAQEEDLDIDKLTTYFNDCLEKGRISESGSYFPTIFNNRPSRFSVNESGESKFEKIKSQVIKKLEILFDKYYQSKTLFDANFLEVEL